MSSQSCGQSSLPLSRTTNGRGSKRTKSKNVQPAERVIKKGNFYVLYHCYLDEDIRGEIQNRLKKHLHKPYVIVQGQANSAMTMLNVTIGADTFQQQVTSLQVLLQLPQSDATVMADASSAKKFWKAMPNVIWPVTKQATLRKFTRGEVSIEELNDFMPRQLPRLKAYEYNRAHLQLRQKKQAPQLEKIRGIYLYGKANAGKTTLSRLFSQLWAKKHDFTGNRIIYPKDLRSDFWGAFALQPCILYDDIDQHTDYQVLSQMKAVVNVGRTIVGVKGGELELAAQMIVVTSQYLPRMIFRQQQLYQALLVRFLFLRCQQRKSQVKGEKPQYFLSMMSEEDVEWRQQPQPVRRRRR